MLPIIDIGNKIVMKTHTDNKGINYIQNRQLILLILLWNYKVETKNKSNFQIKKYTFISRYK